MKKNKLKILRILKKIKSYIVYFYIYAFFGWLIDVSICLVADGVLEKRGFLFGPICPMYGFAALVLIWFSKKIKRWKY